MQIERAGSRPSGKGPAEWFTGTVRIDPLFAPPDPARVVELDDDLRAKRIAMCAAYTTQLGFQFGGRAAMEDRLRRVDRERFHAPSRSP